MPPRSPTIVGSAVETIVWSSDASSSTSISATKIRRTRGAWAVGAVTSADIASTHNYCDMQSFRTMSEPDPDPARRVLRELSC